MASRAKHGDRSTAVTLDSTREHEIRHRAHEIYLERGERITNEGAKEGVWRASCAFMSVAMRAF
jgi:hypothetical protein